ncbi:polysaccharide deacetylase family protein [Candidatus Laterigemmans baculatus]|uniref:polysaccharide deacetylase family protein n=1 Tax=Candidatus Laterigemmans baculatus TaxID=2770505 RepID=UPI00193B460E|nr:polysaccharide deacetylase family protein [Candidatus Laterigemmans baculatus]
MIKRLAIACIPNSVFLRRLPIGMGNCVLLTFDDGPHPETTPAVLQLLEPYNARAIFFVVGNRIHRAPSVLRMIEQAGHLLGNHSFSHPLREPFRYQAYLRDLQKCQQEILKQGATPSPYHRPPLGSISVATAIAPRKLGLRSVLWSRSSEDWRFRSEADAVSSAEQLAASTQPRDIVLMHDESPYTLILLKHLLPALVDRGLRFDWSSDGRI